MASPRYGLYFLVGGMTFTVGLLVVLVLVSHSMIQARQENSRQERIIQDLQQGKLVVVKVDAPVPVTQPEATQWNSAPELEVKLMPQTITRPSLEKQTVENVRIQGLTDGKMIAFRLTWRDPHADMNTDSGRFCDAVAIQFAMQPQTVNTMGSEGHRVHLLHWKALWQKDIDEHYQDVQDLHPNYWTDLYWFAQKLADVGPGQMPYRFPDSFKNPVSLQWFVALSAGNPMSAPGRTSPVEELNAEGFGTLTTQQHNDARGAGRHEGKHWSVVLARPLRTDDPNDYQFDDVHACEIGIAVWDGGAGQVGGRKQWSDWVKVRVER